MYNLTTVPYSAQWLAALSEVFVEVFSAPPWHEKWQARWVEERFECLADSPYFEGQVLLCGDMPIGAMLGRGIPFKGERHFEIVELFVLPAFQGQGGGSLLISTLETLLRQKGYAAMVLLTARDSDPEKFYVAKGFQCYAPLQHMFKRLNLFHERNY